MPPDNNPSNNTPEPNLYNGDEDQGPRPLTYGALDYVNPAFKPESVTPKVTVKQAVEDETTQTAIVLLIVFIGLIVIVSGGIGLFEIFRGFQKLNPAMTVPLIVSFGQVLLGIGLMFRLNIARILTVWLSSINLLFLSISLGAVVAGPLSGGPQQENYASIIFMGAFGLLANVAIIFVLNIRRVRQAFR